MGSGSTLAARSSAFSTEHSCCSDVLSLAATVLRKLTNAIAWHSFAHHIPICVLYLHFSIVNGSSTRHDRRATAGPQATGSDTACTGSEVVGVLQSTLSLAGK